MLAALVVLAVLAPVVAPYAADALDLGHRRAAPSLHHLFGTDELGRDLLTRILYGARISLSIGLVSAALSAGIGVTIGAAAGYAGGFVDAALMRFTDAMLSVPRLPLLMIAAAVFEPSVPLLIALVGAVGWMETARVVRAEVQSIGARDFVTAARASGAGTPRIILAPCASRRRSDDCRRDSPSPSGAASCSRVRSASLASACSRPPRVGATCCTKRRRR